MDKIGHLRNGRSYWNNLVAYFQRNTIVSTSVCLLIKNMLFTFGYIPIVIVCHLWLQINDKVNALACHPHLSLRLNKVLKGNLILIYTKLWRECLSYFHTIHIGQPGPLCCLSRKSLYVPTYCFSLKADLLWLYPRVSLYLS